jgi:hypothetical protein
VAKREKLPLRTTQPFGRDGRTAGANVPGALVAKLFKARRGQAVMEETKIGVVLASVKEIKEVSPSSDPAAVKRLRETVARGIHVDLLTALQGALKDRHGVEIDQDAFKTFFTQNVRN